MTDRYRASQPIASKRGASGSSPAGSVEPCVERRPQSPWYDAGTRTDPAVSVARPTSA